MQLHEPYLFILYMLIPNRHIKTQWSQWQGNVSTESEHPNCLEMDIRAEPSIRARK